MDNNWCGAEDGRLADQEDWANFKKEVIAAIKEEKAPTITGIRKKVGATYADDVRHIALCAGFNLPWA